MAFRILVGGHHEVVRRGLRGLLPHPGMLSSLKLPPLLTYCINHRPKPDPVLYGYHPARAERLGAARQIRKAFHKSSAVDLEVAIRKSTIARVLSPIHPADGTAPTARPGGFCPY